MFTRVKTFCHQLRVYYSRDCTFSSVRPTHDVFSKTLFFSIQNVCHHRGEPKLDIFKYYMYLL